MSALTLDEAKEHLNIETSSDDVEIQRFIDSAEAAIGNRCGYLEPTSITATVDGYTRSLVLPTAPVASLTSVTPIDGPALDPAVLYLNAGAGTVEYVDGSVFTSRRYTVVLSAGRTPTPPDLMLAVKELLRHLWLTQRGAAPGSPGALPNTAEFEVITGQEIGRSYSFPWRVEQLIAAHLQVDL